MTPATELADGADLARRDGIAEQRIEIQVDPVNAAPHIAPLLYLLSPGCRLTDTSEASVIAGDAFTQAVVSEPTLRTLAFNPNGSFASKQTAALDSRGAAFVEDSFTLRATETGHGAQSSDVRDKCGPGYAR